MSPRISTIDTMTWKESLIRRHIAYLDCYLCAAFRSTPFRKVNDSRIGMDRYTQSKGNNWSDAGEGKEQAHTIHAGLGCVDDGWQT